MDDTLTDDDKDALYPELTQDELCDLATPERIPAAVAADPDAAPILCEEAFQARLADGRIQFGTAEDTAHRFGWPPPGTRNAAE